METFSTCGCNTQRLEDADACVSVKSSRGKLLSQADWEESQVGVYSLEMKEPEKKFHPGVDLQIFPPRSENSKSRRRALKLSG